MSSNYAFGVRAFGCNIRAATTSAEARAVLDSYIFPSLLRTAGTLDRPDVDICVDCPDGRFQLSVNGDPLAFSSHAIDLVPDIIRALDDAVIDRLTSLRALHAGVVLWKERAVLLPGASHAGKSSLVFELLRRGATYFSDEYALIDAEGCVHAYPRPLLVRNGRPEQHPVLASECNAPIGNAPARVGWIFALQYDPECRWSVAALTQGEALLTLLRNTPHVLADSPGMVEVFRHAVSEAVCYAGRRSEAVHAVDEILRLIDGPSSA